MIEISNIKKRYKNKIVLSDVNVKAEEGSCVGILGTNGCGKSTLLSILAGVQKPDGGQFCYNGADLFKSAKTREKVVGYVPQGNPLFEELTAWDNLLLWYTREQLKCELDTGVLRMLGISDFLKTPVSKMSGGMKKRLSIGCSMAGNPKVLLMDEPSAALDLVCKEQIYNYLMEYKKQGGIIFLTTHDEGELDLIDDMYILKDGVLNAYEYKGNVHQLVSSL